MIGERVRERRLARSWSVAQLALQAGMTRDGVHKIEATGKGKATAESVAALARALHTSADYLLGLSDNPQPREPLAADERQRLRDLLAQALALLDPS